MNVSFDFLKLIGWKYEVLQLIDTLGDTASKDYFKRAPLRWLSILPLRETGETAGISKNRRQFLSERAYWWSVFTKQLTLAPANASSTILAVHYCGPISDHNF